MPSIPSSEGKPEEQKADAPMDPKTSSMGKRKGDELMGESAKKPAHSQASPNGSVTAPKSNDSAQIPTSSLPYSAINPESKIDELKETDGAPKTIDEKNNENGQNTTEKKTTQPAEQASEGPSSMSHSKNVEIGQKKVEKATAQPTEQPVDDGRFSLFHAFLLRTGHATPETVKSIQLGSYPFHDWMVWATPTYMKEWQNTYRLYHLSHPDIVDTLNDQELAQLWKEYKEMCYYHRKTPSKLKKPMMPSRGEKETEAFIKQMKEKHGDNALYVRRYRTPSYTLGLCYY